MIVPIQHVRSAQLLIVSAYVPAPLAGAYSDDDHCSRGSSATVLGEAGSLSRSQEASGGFPSLHLDWSSGLIGDIHRAEVL